MKLIKTIRTKRMLKEIKNRCRSIGNNCHFYKDIKICNLRESLYFGDNCYVGHQCSFYRLPGGKKIPKLLIGNEVNINNRCKFVLAEENISIGSKTLIGPGSMFYAFNHSLSEDGSFNGPIISKEIIIGENCWIVSNVIILAGVHIGNGCVVGAGSVVTKSFSDNVMIAGNPAKIIKTLDMDSRKWIRKE